MDSDNEIPIEKLKREFPAKFVSENEVFSLIHPGDRIFIGTGCGEPQYLVAALIQYVESHPKAFFDAEVLHVWTMGLAPYTDKKFKQNFRHNSFFIGNNTRDAINQGLADYTPIFLSQVPGLLRRQVVPVDIALIQTSLPDSHGYMSLGVSVDITKDAADNARIVVAQVNKEMPRCHGNTFLHISNVDFVICHDEPLLEYEPQVSDEIAERIGKYVARFIEDGDTIQVGYGSIPNAIIASLRDKKHLGLHTELISDGIVELIKSGVIDNSRKNLHMGKSVASFCMGSKLTYEFLHDNPGVEFHPIDYINNPLTIAANNNMVAINSALAVDLTGQSTAESLDRSFYSGVGGQADFMRGAVLSPGGKTILALQSTANDEKTSRIVPFLPEGAGVTLTRGDIHYIATEYGIAYLHGKNVRERAMDIISIAHPKFRPWLIDEAKKNNLIYRDQAFIPGKRGEYPEFIETRRTTESGLALLFRPVKINDEPSLKDFFYSLSDKSIYRRFMSVRRDVPHELLQEFVVIDYSKEMVILAIKEDPERPEIVGVGQYGMQEDRHSAEVAFVVKDEYHNRGVGTELLSFLTMLAKKQGLFGFTAEVLVGNTPMLHLFENQGFDIEKRMSSGVFELKMAFKAARIDK
jgi:acyl-CoA hydrolase/RimJ/RimL family protein N-acetyltransferase